MFDISAISAGIGTLKTAAQVIQEAGKIDLYEKILQMMGQLTEAKIEILRLTEREKELLSRLAVKEQVMRDGDTYRLSSGDTDARYCSVCYDTKEVLVLLRYVGFSSAEYWCPSCKNGGFTNIRRPHPHRSA